MDWLNYHHLLYFWTVAKEGSVSAAARKLHLAQPTLSSQIKKLEKSIGHDLFQKTGRHLTLTESGRLVFRYADEIFGLGRELLDTLRNATDKETPKLRVGVQGALPKLVVYELLRPALESEEERYHVICREGKLAELLNELALHRLDIVLADRPLTPDNHIRAYNHLLGECGVTVFAHGPHARKYRSRFPESLDGAPVLLPTPNTSLRQILDQWFDDNNIHPRIVHEFEDSAVLKVFGQAGHGLFFSPTAIEAEVQRQYAVKVVGRLPEIVERFFAISIERRLKHSAVVKISQFARNRLFANNK